MSAKRQFSSLRDGKYGLTDKIMELGREIRDLASKFEELAESKAESASENHAKRKSQTQERKLRRSNWNSAPGGSSILRIRMSKILSKIWTN